MASAMQQLDAEVLQRHQQEQAEDQHLRDALEQMAHRWLEVELHQSPGGQPARPTGHEETDEQDQRGRDHLWRELDSEGSEGLLGAAQGLDLRVHEWLHRRLDCDTLLYCRNGSRVIRSGAPHGHVIP
jgi:hypothetical protein